MYEDTVNSKTSKELQEFISQLEIRKSCKTCASGDIEGRCHGQGESGYENAQICKSYVRNTASEVAVEVFKVKLEEDLNLSKNNIFEK